MEVDAIRHLIDDRVAGDRQVRHRSIEPDASLGVLDVKTGDRRVAQRSTDPVYLVCVDALTDVTFDREVGQVNVGAATLAGVEAVEADSGVDRAVGGGRTQRDLMTLEDGVPTSSSV